MASMGKIEIVLSEEVRQFIKQVQSGSSGCSGTEAGQLERISEALSEYHGALNARKNSSLAASKFVGECEMILQFRRSQ